MERTTDIRCSACLRSDGRCERSARISQDRTLSMYPVVIIGIILALFCGASASEVATASPVIAPLPVQPVTSTAGDMLQTGDLLRITVYENPDLSVDVRVPGEGMVQFPLLGRIAILPGTSSETFARQLQDRLEATYLNRAMVTVTVKEYGVRRCYVMGGVVRPGAFPLSPAMSATSMRAISEAGGLLDDADRRNIVVMRDDGRGVSVALSVRVDGTPPGDVTLLPNDLILVSRLERIYLTGQVKIPGSIPSNLANLTVAHALSAVGGFAAYARMSQVQLLRSGQPVRAVDVVAIMAGEAIDPVLIPGDMLHVPERRF
jgi:polysaccharide export outer membrane protein